MKKRLLKISFLLFCISCYSQGEIRGVVYYQNSKCKTCLTPKSVEGVRINASKANSVYSKNAGEFRLLFQHSSIGDPVTISIGENGNTDILINKTEIIELVNDKELENINIPSNASISESKTIVIVCPKGERDQWAAKHYKILFKSADEKRLLVLEKQNKRLEEELKNRPDSDTLKKLYAKIAELEKPIDSLKIYENAFYIASINKDFAIKEVNKAINLFEERNVDAAMDILNKTEIKAASSLKLMNSKPTREALELIAKLNFQQKNYEKSIKTYLTLIDFGEDQQLDNRIMANYYESLCSVYVENIEYEKALICCKKSETIYKRLGADNTILSTQIASIYKSTGEYKSALEYFNKSKGLFKKAGQEGNILLAYIYLEIIEIYNLQGNEKEANKLLEEIKVISPIIYEWIIAKNDFNKYKLKDDNN